MVIAVTDVLTRLNQPDANAGADGYLFFRIFEIKTTTITQVLALAQAHCEAMIDEGTRNTYATLFDHLVINEAALRLLRTNIRAQMAASGFSFNATDLNIDMSRIPDVLKETVISLTKERDELLGILRPRVSVIPQTRFGEDPWGIMEENFPDTSVWYP